MFRKMLTVFFVLSISGLSACGRFCDLGPTPGIGLDPATWVTPHYPYPTNGEYVYEEKACAYWGGPCRWLQRYQAHPQHRDYNSWTYPEQIGRDDAASVAVDVGDGTRYTLEKFKPYRRVVTCIPLYSENVGNRVQCTPRYYPL